MMTAVLPATLLAALPIAPISAPIAVAVLVGFLIGLLIGAALYFAGLRRGEHLGRTETRADLDSIARAAADQSNQTAREAYEQATGRALETLQAAARSAREIERTRLESATAPLHESLRNVTRLASELEQKRARDHGTLTEVAKRLANQVETVVGSARSLREALRGDRQARGRWGEIQLQTLVESAGLQEHCDFAAQTGKNGVRPDLVLRLPGGASLAVDSKVPMDDYLDATEEAANASGRQTELLRSHAGRVRQHAKALSAREYPAALGVGPPFTVMFLPIESLLAEAIRHDPDLLQFAADRRIVLATPHTLLGLLWSIAAMWRNEISAQNVEAMRREGLELEKRLGLFLSRFADVGAQLRKTTSAYNTAVGSAETRLTPHLRKLRELGGSPEETPNDDRLPDPVEIVPRLPRGDDGTDLLPQRALLS